MEQWKEIAGYNGYYEVSDLGNVRSLPRRLTDGRMYKGCMLVQKTARNGYKQVHLSKGNMARWISVHRLVADAFVPNPNNLPQVNHIDENKQNNCASNLSWVSASENCKYGNRNATMVQQRSVCVVATDGCMEYQFNSIQEAARELHISAGHISQCCNGKRKTAGGYFWFHK